MSDGSIVRLVWVSETRELIEKEGFESKVIGHYPENALPPQVPGYIFGDYEKLKDNLKFQMIQPRILVLFPELFPTLDR
jgi:hypothetical protein